MRSIPSALQAQFEAYLGKRAVPYRLHREYTKWLRNYLDFCEKYRFPPARRDSLPRFISKLQGKKQPEDQREQAAKAINLYYQIVSKVTLPSKEPYTYPPAYSKTSKDTRRKILSFHEVTGKPALYPNTIPTPPLKPDQRPQRSGTTQSGIPSEKRTVDGIPFNRGSGASWKDEYSRLADAIQVRHYSPKTLQTYRGWVQKFQDFTRSKGTELLSSDDVKTYLTFLVVQRKVSATTQNQAFNSLLFFYRHVLNKEFGKIDGVVRAKRKTYIPVVLSRKEIETILKHLGPPYALIVKLLYGCGLRLFECLRLRVHFLNFDAGFLTVHDGQGQKDRTVPLPERILAELENHIDSLKDLHQQDLDRKYAGVFLVNALEKKYKNAAREFIWQWVFPAKVLTVENRTGELRRYHLHATHVQKAIKEAVGKARITKRATAHTLRHSFASHLLQANYDIRTIQALLGHSDVRTTMVYTRTVKSVTIKEAKSPLDF